jgi:hypothetical protein
MPIPTKKKGEHAQDFMTRCMSDEKMISEYTDPSQRYAICSSQLSLAVNPVVVSFDYDDTLSTAKGRDKALEWIAKGAELWIITARCKDGNNLDLIDRAKELKIPLTRVIFTCHKDKYLVMDDNDIDIHYDNNKDQVDLINQKTDTQAILFK